MQDGRRFWAFLSYSHKDRDWATWLHRALETYPVPLRLVGRQNPAGPIPKRLRPIFKDRDDLAANPGLRERVEAALATSSALIVVCSPMAAASTWVEEEVVRFKALHGEGRVFAVIVAGTPGASRLAGREAEECFPPALRFHVDAAGALTDQRTELVAADLRPNGDGRRLARLKLVAGILGLDLDELVQRDAARRAKRLTALAAASLAGAAAMGALAVAALVSRDEARAQRAQAEGLVEFMLGDLRKKLEPTGRLDLLDTVGGRAMAYYRAQARHGLDDEALGRRARVLNLLGQIQEKRGNLQVALREFSEASTTTAELLARSPESAERIHNHAQSVYYVGEVAYQRGDDDRALAAFLEYKSLTERGAAIVPSDVDERSELADVEINLGSLWLKKHRPAEALPAFRRALEIERGLAQRSRADRSRQADLADAYGWLSDAEAMAGSERDALDHRLAERRICEQILAEHPDDSAAAESLMVNQRAVARIYSKDRDLRAAGTELAQSTKTAERLMATDRTNIEYKSEAVSSYADLGRALLAQRRLAAAATAARRADDLAEALASKDPTVDAWTGVQLGDVRLLRIRIAAAAAAQGAACRRALAPAAEESARLVRISDAKPNDLPLAHAAAEALLLDGDFQYLSSRPRQARQAWASAKALLARAAGAEATARNERSHTLAAELVRRETSPLGPNRPADGRRFPSGARTVPNACSNGAL